MSILTKKLLIFCILPISLTAGYESTQKEDQIARAISSGSYDEAFLTSRAEEISRLENVNDAYITETEEELQRRGIVDEAGLTSAAERAARS